MSVKDGLQKLERITHPIRSRMVYFTSLAAAKIYRSLGEAWVESKTFVEKEQMLRKRFDS